MVGDSRMVEGKIGKHYIVVILGIVLLLLFGGGSYAHTVNTRGSDDPLGWFPTLFKLKDHTVFSYDGHYYIASIYISDENVEDRFAYARSADLVHWEDVGPILTERRPGAWDESRVWAPFVLSEDGVYYMFYAGVTEHYAQSIVLAPSTDPANPSGWQEHGVIFQPDHKGMVWGGFSQWSNCRDPTVVRVGDLYYMYYTGLDTAGGIVGLATAPTLYGPWRDWGSVLTIQDVMLESPLMIAYDSYHYLCFNEAGQSGRGEHCVIGPTLSGPWTAPYSLSPGWAHEVWRDPGGDLYTSYLTGYYINISPLTWDTIYDPPHPFIGSQVFHTWMPLLIHEEN